MYCYVDHQINEKVSPENSKSVKKYHFEIFTPKFILQKRKKKKKKSTNNESFYMGHHMGLLETQLWEKITGPSSYKHFQDKPPGNNSMQLNFHKIWHLLCEPFDCS